MPPMANATVEKMEVDEPKNAEVKPAPEVVKDPTTVALETLKEHCALLDKGETHLISRVIQVLGKTRKMLNNEVLHRTISQQPSANPHFAENLNKHVPFNAPPAPAQLIPVPMETNQSKPSKSPRKSLKPTNSSPESDNYLQLLVLMYLVDKKNYKESIDVASSIIKSVEQHDRRSLDPIAAKAFFYLCLVHERLDSFKSLQNYLNAKLRSATLRRFPESQAVLIYSLLRCYLINRQYHSAAGLVSKVSFPEGANNNDLARYMYYQGRIKALQLDYTEASGYFLQAQRKAPQEGAIGFKQTVQKWIIVINLLQGEIPDRHVFRQPIFRKCLAPYLELTHAVRLGDIAKFNSVLQQFSNNFESDDTLTLIVRLRQNVIKTAIKQISVAYSRIYIKDIAKKLLMDNEIETEYIVAKAIADGAIDAVITCDTKDGVRYMQSSETADVYRTTEPQTHFDSRIKYCLELHNQAVKALRYPPKNKVEVESIEQQREREQQELEFAKELAEEDEDDF
ncbi:unnamed protein product [Caenorhabditis auriculariae]|uniref:PCI domain-containing protein n=1 Tax=Caenorhabditis auriculariae TaxID=2777116 RepID=A0A8S1H6N6_9PELO|nr:unnamed protein product [Caenorhabditis auriculariae]